MERQRQTNGRLRVVVAGAGIVGASVAYQLSRRNAAVTVIEKDRPGSGASGRTFAWINATGKTPASYHHFNRRSVDMWDRFARQLGVDVGLRWGGQLQWHSTPEGAKMLRERVQRLQGWGYPCRMIDEDELRHLEPGLSPGPVAAASFSEIDGEVDPQLVIDACLKRVAEGGGTVRTDTPVTGLVLGRTGGGKARVEAVRTDKGEVACDVLVLAAGVGVTELAAMAGVPIPQQESPGVVIITDPRPPLLRTVPVLYSPPLKDGRREIHLRQSPDGTVTIGGAAHASVSRDDSPENAEALLARAVHYLPALAGATAIPLRVVYRPMPQDGYPVLGFPAAAPNVYLTLTHSGVTLAPLVGELASLEIVEGAQVEMLSGYRPGRFS